MEGDSISIKTDWDYFPGPPCERPPNPPKTDFLAMSDLQICCIKNAKEIVFKCIELQKDGCTLDKHLAELCQAAKDYLVKVFREE